MTRRVLRKIDPALDWSKYLLVPQQLPQPWDSTAVFDRPAPLELEIGSGKGLFLAQAAAKQPDHNFIGIEIAERYATYSAARLARSELANARMIHGNAERVFAECLPDGAAIAVHIYFPDPWWKNRHHKRRVMNDQFLPQVERILQSGGSLHFWTDVEEYFQAAVERITAVTKLAGPIAVPQREAQHDLDYQTHFERRTRLHGEAVYRSEFRKEAD
jgi:tRNA (guanine-N7-)-methyltransferase